MLTCYWPRAILHVDMNAFFASVEQRDFPELRGRPVAVTNGETGTTIITCSYEARAHGVHTGMRIYEARRLCPGLVHRPARPQQYARVSGDIMRALVDISPDVEVFSVDEAFLDVTHCQRLHGPPERMAQMARELIERVSDGLPCSIGVAGTKLVAKVASELNKPNGMTIIPPWEARERLKDVPVERICGVGPNVAEFLALHDARTCGQVAELPLAVLERRYGLTGKRLWLACQGADLDPIASEAADPKTVGHGKVLPPHTASRRVIETYLRHMCEKVAARLRRFEYQAGRLMVALRYEGRDGAERTLELPYGPPDGKAYYALARQLLDARWRGQAVTQVQVTATQLKQSGGQLDLFTTESQEANRAAALDRINRKYGEFTVAPATLLERSTAPNVISPGWRPDGPRQTIPD